MYVFIMSYDKCWIQAGFGDCKNWEGINVEHIWCVLKSAMKRDRYITENTDSAIVIYSFNKQMMV